MALIIDIQTLARGSLPSRGKIYLGPYSGDPINESVPVWTDSNYTISILSPINLDDDGMPINSEGDRVNLYTNVSYSKQIRDKYDTDFYQTPPKTEVLDIDPDGNAVINIIQPEIDVTPNSVGTPSNPYEFGYFEKIQLAVTPLITDVNLVPNIALVNALNEIQDLAIAAALAAANAAGIAASNAQSTANGRLQSVAAGTNVSIDNTDPLNPIISASGGTFDGDLPGESGAAYDIHLGEVTANDLFGGIINPLLRNVPVSDVINFLARYVNGAAQGIAVGSIIDAARTDNTQNYFGIVRDTAGAPSFASVAVSGIYNSGLDASWSVQTESGGVQHNPLLFTDVNGGTVDGLITADTFTILAEMILGAGTNIVPGFAYGSNANGEWCKLYDSAGNTLLTICGMYGVNAGSGAAADYTLPITLANTTKALPVSASQDPSRMATCYISSTNTINVTHRLYNNTNSAGTFNYIVIGFPT